MSLPQITITPAGFAAIVNAEHDGTAPVRITQVGVTPQAFNVDTVGAAVPGEIKRISTFGGKAVAVDTLHLNIRDDSSDTYTLHGFGLYLSNGVLFAVYSQATPIMEKAAAATLLLATDIRFAKITATSIEVGDVDFINPPASTTIAGVARFATDDEAAAGSGNAVAMTPNGVAIYIDKRFGSGAPSDFFKGLMTKASAALLRAALGLKSASLKDEGANNGLDADMLDGQHGAYYLDWTNLTGVPTRFTPAPHTHPVSEVDGLQGALDARVMKTGGTITGTLNVWAGLLVGQGSTGTALRTVCAPENVYLDARANAGVDAYTASLSIRAAGFVVEAGGNPNALRCDSAGISATSIVSRSTVTAYGAAVSSSDASTMLRLRESGASGEGRRLDVFLQGTANVPSSQMVRFRFIGAPTAVMDVNSFVVNGTVNAAGGYDVGSSRKLKDIKGELPYGLEEVRRIRTVYGSYKPDYNPDGRMRLFFDAEQLIGIIPEMVDAEGVLFKGKRVGSVKLDQGLPVAFNAIRQLADLVDDLRAELDAVKGAH